MDNVSFSVHFQGPAVEGNLIDAAYLECALMRIEDLVNVAGRELYGSKCHFTGSMQAYTPGSYRINFSVGQESRPSGVLHFISYPQWLPEPPVLIPCLINLLIALIDAIRVLGEQRIKKKEDVPGDKKVVILVLDNDERRKFLKDVLHLYCSRAVREKLELLVVDLLNKDGIEAISLGTDDNKTKAIKKDDAHYFSALKVNDDHNINEIKKWILEDEGIMIEPAENMHNKVIVYGKPQYLQDLPVIQDCTGEIVYVPVVARTLVAYLGGGDMPSDTRVKPIERIPWFKAGFSVYDEDLPPVAIRVEEDAQVSGGIMDGDKVIINLSDRDLVQGSIMLVIYHGMCSLKRVYALKTGEVLLQSDDDEIVLTEDEQEASGFNVLGAVVSVLHCPHTKPLLRK